MNKSLSNSFKWDVNEVKSFLQKIHEIGEKQLESLKKEEHEPILEHKNFIKKDIVWLPEETLVDWKILRYFFMDNFWKLFEMISNDLSNPLSQFAIRSLLEVFTNRILNLYLMEDQFKRDIATKYYLLKYAHTLQRGQQGYILKKYKSLNNQLIDDKEREKFEKIADNGFKTDRNECKSLFKENDQVIKRKKEKYLHPIYSFSSKENDNKERIKLIHSDLSEYIHGNMFLLMDMFKDRESHLKRSSYLLMFLGIRMLEFTNKEVLSQEINILDIIDKGEILAFRIVKNI
ncbi:hypothetical protein HN748_00940 [Candidatus Peregrinibacteria bacterium]|nr:hypothetical protein [Candidatus Peregrinibacteria bacterium]MBT7483505.1 hypothetical protein [Candidatus Peregrinibacteria bacterium]MBT7702777.1 hypothetical protein [Candidatus Peregrinibacteria bacterium]